MSSVARASQMSPSNLQSLFTKGSATTEKLRDTIPDQFLLKDFF